MLFNNFNGPKKILSFLTVIVNLGLIIFSGYYLIKPFYIATFISRRRNLKKEISHSDWDWLSTYQLNLTFSNKIKYVQKEWQAIQDFLHQNHHPSLNDPELNRLLVNFKKKMSDQYFLLARELENLKNIWSQTNWSSFLGNQNVDHLISHLKEENCKIWQRKMDDDYQKTPLNELHKTPYRYIPYSKNICQNDIVKNYLFRYRMHIDTNNLKKCLGQPNMNDAHLTFIMKCVRCYEKVRFFFDTKYQKYYHDSTFLEVDDDHQLITKMKKMPDYLLIRRLIRLVFNPKMNDFNDLDFKIVDQYFTALVDLVVQTKEILNF